MTTATAPSIESLKGQKATMLIQNSVGATVLRHIKIAEGTRVYESDYRSNFDSGLVLYYTLKGKRNAKGFKISSKETRLAIVLGWQSVEGMTESSRVRGQFSYQEWACFDDSQWATALGQLSDVAYVHE